MKEGNEDELEDKRKEGKEMQESKGKKGCMQRLERREGRKEWTYKKAGGEGMK